MAKKKVVSKTRRANNEGSIFKRKDGRWAGYISLGFDENGNAKRKIIYGKSQSEVAKKLTEISGRVKSNSYEIVENKTFGELMLDWLLVFKKSAVTPRTFESNIRNFNLHIKPIIGNMKVYEVDNFAVQKVMNAMIENGYSNDTIKKNKHLISQFFEYAIDNKWVTTNPTHKIKIQNKDRKFYDDKEHYKALPPDIRDKFIDALNKDESNFIKPLCITQMFSGTRIGEVLAIKWKNIDFENKTMRIERAITQVPKFDNVGNVIDRITVVGDTKTTCSVREIPIADIVVDTLKEWREKQILRQKTSKNVTADLTGPNSFIFANDDGSVRTYSGTRKIFNRFLKRNGLDKCGIHFHGLRHTFSNMLFEMNENPKVIQQLLGHRDVKTTITVYNSVNSDDVREATDKLNTKISQQEQRREERQKEMQEDYEDFDDLTDEELDYEIEELIRQKERREKQKDFEM
jgi:integrase